MEPTRRGEFWAGAKATIPLIVGAIPFGIIFGALAVRSGFSPAGAAGMSFFVFAGSSQFIATSLAAGGATTLFIVLTTFVVNLRHALYSATLGPYVKHLPQRWLLPLGFWLTDESFVVAVQRYRAEDSSPYKHWFFLGSAVFMYANWNLCTWIGIFTGQAIPPEWGLEFAMVVTFIGMLVPLIIGRPTLVAVFVAGVTAVLANNLPNRLGLLVAAMLGILAGVLAERFFGEPDNE
ncbi:MAG: branched-chain amino acid ABC transporter permease [Chloroflexi bacterium]|nr:MAG: branched-chain amino acid ABC transporter permease [Chloroflexota bacterium]MBL1194783.1 branched-chain amino acid ABC transporter permease [Chloroflexota bacterium]NOH12075.1 AzlC family ABC transporter permease [Chloroflexota bacterium]